MGTLTLDGVEYVVVPRAEYLRLTGAPADAVDAVEYGRKSIGRTLKAAREHAGLSQAELAAKVDKSQSAVSGFEAGRIAASEDYVLSVLKACGLPKNWVGPKAKR